MLYYSGMSIDKLLTRFMRHYTSANLKLDRTGLYLPEPPKKSAPLLLYLHIPFCEGLCPYCSFFRIPFDRETALTYFQAVKKELGLYRKQGFNFSEIYIGGGTPTILPDELASLIEYASGLWTLNDISVETNPNHLTQSTLETLKNCGVSRLSVGIQTFDDGLLDQVNRLKHYGSGTEIAGCVKQAKGMFDTLNLDMIFNLPGQTDEILRHDIEVLLALEPDQITYYPLMGSDNKLNNADVKGRVRSNEKDFYRIISSELGEQYSMATAYCFTRKTGLIDEYIIGHDEYVGAGAGAFSYFNGVIHSNTFSIDNYIDSLKDEMIPIAGKREFPRGMRIKYYMLMKLFGGELKLSGIKSEFGKFSMGHVLIEIAAMLVSRSAVYSKGTIRVTPKGRYYLVVLMREFFNGVNNFRDMMKNTARIH